VFGGIFATTLLYPGNDVANMNDQLGFAPPVNSAPDGEVVVEIFRTETSVEDLGGGETTVHVITVTMPEIAGTRIDGYAVEIRWGTFELTYELVDPNAGEPSTGGGTDARCDISDPNNWSQRWSTINLNWTWSWWNSPFDSTACDCDVCDPTVDHGDGEPQQPQEPIGEWDWDTTGVATGVRESTVSVATNLNTDALGNLGFSVSNRSSQPVTIGTTITNLQGLGLGVTGGAATLEAVVGQVTTDPVSQAFVETVYGNVTVPASMPAPTTAGTVARVIVTVSN